MRISCPCGNTIVDAEAGLPGKAYLRADEDDSRYADAIFDEAARIARRFRAAKLAEAEGTLLLDLQELGMIGSPLERKIYECPSCGRLLVQVPSRDAFVSYLAETPRRGVLRSGAALDEQTDS